MTGGPVSAEEAESGRAGGRPLLRLLWLAGPLRGRLALSVLAGAAATGFGVALLATSGYMLARASEHPSILAHIRRGGRGPRVQRGPRNIPLHRAPDLA